MLETPKGFSEPDEWKRYIETRKNDSPSLELISAVTLVKHKHSALDIGAGPLISTRYLRQQGFEKV